MEIEQGLILANKFFVERSGIQVGIREVVTRYDDFSITEYQPAIAVGATIVWTGHEVLDVETARRVGEDKLARALAKVIGEVD